MPSGGESCRITTFAHEADIGRPELNRHGDSDAHHALPAVQTGKHGIDDNGLVGFVIFPASYMS